MVALSKAKAGQKQRNGVTGEVLVTNGRRSGGRSNKQGEVGREKCVNQPHEIGHAGKVAYMNDI